MYVTPEALEQACEYYRTDPEAREWLECALDDGLDWEDGLTVLVPQAEQES